MVGIALAVVIVVAVVVGIWRSVASRAPEESGEPPQPPAATTSAPYEHPGDEGASDTPTAPPPTNVPSTGTDADEHSLTPAEEAVVMKRAAAFWKAFSVRDPETREQELAKVAVPYLAQRMSVPSTSRIPVITPVRSAVVDGSFSQATVVSEAIGSSQNKWWYVTLVFDPVTETWSAQAYEEASPGLIAAAQKIMKNMEGR
ncbi:hypothetical protein [Microlunatus parietis]|uniref:Uncharacterized protein n=1 Tax=Microlunatus parietis TaxID=682979 RepID=A0A7Y9LCC3_9ACTN|nr:hypothetical protein [Microlunatus parietis]